MIEIKNIVKEFASRDGNKVLALTDVSLNVEKNEFIAVVGRSGCGKSTLLRLIAGLVPATSGTIALGGTEVDGPRRDTSVVFQTPTLLPWTSILKNVLFPLKMMRQVQPDSAERAIALLKLVGLSGFENKYPSELSGGMQQRAAICRALILNPTTLLMDEPFGALDALTREEMSLELMRIQSQQPKTIVFITHSIPEAVLLADRVVVMSDRPGRISEIIDVPLPRPRTFELEASNEFQECAQHIRALIFGNRVRGVSGAA